MHELDLHLVLDVFHAHVVYVDLRDGCRDFGCKDDVLTFLGHSHRLEDGVYDLSVVENHDSAVALNYVLYHIKLSVKSHAL